MLSSPTSSENRNTVISPSGFKDHAPNGAGTMHKGRPDHVPTCLFDLGLGLLCMGAANKCECKEFTSGAIRCRSALPPLPWFPLHSASHDTQPTANLGDRDMEEQRPKTGDLGALPAPARQPPAARASAGPRGTPHSDAGRQAHSRP